MTRVIQNNDDGMAIGMRNHFVTGRECILDARAVRFHVARIIIKSRKPALF